MFSRIQAITFTMKNYKKTDIEKQGLLDRKKRGFSRIFEAFDRLWTYFCPPLARLFRGRISKRKKRGLCPDLGPPLARPVERRSKSRCRPEEAAGRIEKPFRPEWGGMCLSVGLTRPGPCTQGHAGFSPQSGILRRAPLRGTLPARGVEIMVRVVAGKRHIR